MMPQLDSVHDAGPQGGSKEWLERYHRVMLPVFSPSRVLVRGQGAYVWDADDKRYLDLFAGIAVTALGHAHPAWCSAVGQQMERLCHVSNHAASPQQILLAEKLASLTPNPALTRVFLSNSGAEAVEAALKMALRTGRPKILAQSDAFHGRTLGALALTSKEEYRKPFEPLPGGVRFLPHGDLAALQAEMDTGVGAIVLEVVQGEGGVRRLPPDFLPEARRLADAFGALLIVDEVQTGIGRTGTWFAHANPRLVPQEVIPDIVTLAKGLGAGFPIGATLTLTDKAAGLLGPGQHGTTFGGNPLAAAAGLATLKIIEEDHLLDSASQVGALLADAIASLGHPMIEGVRGAGLLLAVELAGAPAAQVAERAADAGFLVNAVTPSAFRLAPPLILSSDQALAFVDALPNILAGTERNP